MRLILTLLALIYAGWSFAQDKLITTSGQRLSVRVVSIDSVRVTYHVVGNENGPIYSMSKSGLKQINFENGRVESFDRNVIVEKVRSSYEAGKNMFGFDMMTLLFSEFQISYERIVANGYLGFKVPFQVGIGNTTNGPTLSQNPINLASGVDINVYPSGQGRVRYFVGPGFRIGSVKSEPEEYYYQNQGKIFPMYSAQINNGIIIQVTKSLTISSSIGIGRRKIQGYYEGFDLFGNIPNYITLGSTVNFRF